ncbi:MAG: hypothetical protein AAF242_10915 [Bacteroidota bacterium]
MTSRENHTGSQTFIALTSSIRNSLPNWYFCGIILSYTINAVMIGFFLFPTLQLIVGKEAAIFICITGAGVIQLFRYLIVFTDLLYPEAGLTSRLQVKLVAAVMTIVGVFELYHLLSTFNITIPQLISVFVFGASIIVGGWLMEVNFIKKTNEFMYNHLQFEMVKNWSLQKQRERNKKQAFAETQKNPRIETNENGDLSQENSNTRKNPGIRNGINRTNIDESTTTKPGKNQELVLADLMQHYEEQQAHEDQSLNQEERPLSFNLSLNGHPQ